VVNEEAKRFDDAFDEHDQMRLRLGLEPVGDRPWYMMPAQFGKKIDNTYILHCRHCDQFRLKGDDTGLKKKKGVGAIKLSSINVEAVMKYKQRLLSQFIFCKECKHYKGEEHEYVLGDVRVSHVDKLYEPVLETGYDHGVDVSSWSFDQLDERTNPDRVVESVESDDDESSESWLGGDDIERKYDEIGPVSIFDELDGLNYEHEDEDSPTSFSDEEEQEESSRENDEDDSGTVVYPDNTTESVVLSLEREESNGTVSYPVVVESEPRIDQWFSLLILSLTLES
jgi:hypothetical protein